jgi:hypothetical protein
LVLRLLPGQQVDEVMKPSSLTVKAMPAVLGWLISTYVQLVVESKALVSWHSCDVASQAAVCLTTCPTCGQLLA